MVDPATLQALVSMFGAAGGGGAAAGGAEGGGAMGGMMGKGGGGGSQFSDFLDKGAKIRPGRAPNPFVPGAQGQQAMSAEGKPMSPGGRGSAAEDMGSSLGAYARQILSKREAEGV